MADEQEKKQRERPDADAGLQKHVNYHLQRIIDHLWGPTGSVILHIGLVILLINLVIMPNRPDAANIEVTVVEPDAKDLEEFEKRLDELKDVEIEITPPDAQMLTETPPEVEAPPSAQPEDLAALDISAEAQSPLIMKGLFAGRSAGGRARSLGEFNRRYGQATEAAVIKALEWLKNHQLGDGSWEGTGGARNKVAMTGLGLLCFLSHGETHTSERYGPTVDRAIKYLVSQQEDNGAFKAGSGTGGGLNAYANGIAAYAACEAYALTRIPSLRVVMEKAVSYIIAGMQDTGGYTYGYAKNGRRDTSVAGWQAQAMKAAYIAGADVPGLKEAMERCVNGFKMNYDAGSGKFRYAPEPGKDSGPTWACTAIGTLCLQLLGHGNSDQVEGALKAMEPLRCDWTDPEGVKRELYAWYYMTQAKFHKGKSTWENWNNSFAKVMIERQNADGSWTPQGEEERGYGPVYGTEFSALSLMVYYRFLPTYKEIKIDDAPTEKQADDVVVDII